MQHSLHAVEKAAEHAKVGNPLRGDTALDRFRPRGATEAIVLVAGLFFLLQGFGLLTDLALSIYDEAVQGGVVSFGTLLLVHDSVSFGTSLLFLIVGVVLLVWSRQIHAAPTGLPAPPYPP